MKDFYLIRTDLSNTLVKLIEKMKAADRPGMLIQITQEEHEALRASVRIKKKKHSKKKGIL